MKYLRHWCLLVLSVFVLSESSVSTVFANTPHTSTMKKVSYTVTVTASVGASILTIYGYTSPDATVHLEGIGVAHETKADDKGYFIFNQVFLPEPQERFISNFIKEAAFPELFLVAVDTEKHSSFPFSLPPLRTGPYAITVGPVLLPPTVSLEKGQFLPKEQIIASGQTIPNSEVTIFLANNDNVSNFWQKLFSITPFAYIIPNHTYAYTLPSYHIVADNHGSFQFNLPANSPSNWKIFASSFFLDSPSPKSNTLTFKVLNHWQWLWVQIKQIILAIYRPVASYFWFIIIVLELVVIGFALRGLRIRADRPPRRSRHKTKTKSEAIIFTD